MRAKSRLPLLSIATLVIVLVAIGFYLRANTELLDSLANVFLSNLIVLIATRVLSIATSGLFLRLFAEKFNIQLRVKEWFGLAIITAMGNYLTPFSGGMMVRATYLKQRHAFPYAQFATLLTANYLVIFWVVGVVGAMASLAFMEDEHFSWLVMLSFLVVVIAISILVMLPTIELSEQHRITRLLNTALKGWNLVKTDRLLLAKLAIVSLWQVLLNGFSFWLAYQAIGKVVSFSAALLVSLINVFSILLNITPGNLGVQEAVISFSSTLVGAGTGAGLLTALLIRASTLAVVFTLGPLFSFLLTQELHEKV